MSPEELVAKWQHVLNECAEPFTWTEPASLAYCAEIASKSEWGVEIGTYMGASALVMLRANPNLHLWCVDTFAVAGTKKVTEYWLRKEIADGRCELIVGDSATAGGMLQHMKGKLDMVWVDDGHATEDVIRDITSFRHLMKRGGVMFGHDFEVPFNDVALGVIHSLGKKFTIPVPRVWSYTHTCCG